LFRLNFTHNQVARFLMNGSIELEQYEGLDADVVEVVDPNTHRRTLLRSASSLTLAANAHVRDVGEDDGGGVMMEEEVKSVEDVSIEFAVPKSKTKNNTNDNIEMETD
jgi:hypothetical protein